MRTNIFPVLPRQVAFGAAAVGMSLTLAACGGGGGGAGGGNFDGEVKVGILHSLSGTMPSRKPL